MSNTSRFVSSNLVLSSVLVVTGCFTLSHVIARAETPKDGSLKIDDRTPEAAIRAFYGALAKGDARSAGQLLVNTDEMEEWTEIQAKSSIAFKRLGTAAVARFGDEGKSLQFPVPADIAVQKLETVKVALDGDKAEWPVNPRVPLKLQRIDGHWKLDIRFPSPAHLKETNDVHGKIATYIGKIASDIEDGTLKSIADVREELKRQREAMNK